MPRDKAAANREKKRRDLEYIKREIERLEARRDELEKELAETAPPPIAERAPNDLKTEGVIPMAETNAEKLLRIALGPKRASNAEGSMEGYSIEEIKAAIEVKEQEEAASAATQSPPMRLFKLIPPGAD